MSQPPDCRNPAVRAFPCARPRRRDGLGRCRGGRGLPGKGVRWCWQQMLWSAGRWPLGCQTIGAFKRACGTGGTLAGSSGAARPSPRPSAAASGRSSSGQPLPLQSARISLPVGSSGAFNWHRPPCSAGDWAHAARPQARERRLAGRVGGLRAASPISWVAEYGVNTP